MRVASYASRKAYAEARPRIKGRFAKVRARMRQLLPLFAICHLQTDVHIPQCSVASFQITLQGLDCRHFLSGRSPSLPPADRGVQAAQEGLRLTCR